MTAVRTALRSFFRFLLPAVLGVLLIAELVALTLFLVPLMGVGDSLTEGATRAVTTVWWSGTVNRPMLFVIVSLAGGALGGALHGVASLTSHVAAGDFGPRWTLWYLTNPFVGAALAAVFLFVLQAGLGGQAATGSQGGLYGIAAVAALTGLFSRHALAKLKDVFDVVFASRESVRQSAANPGTVALSTVMPVALTEPSSSPVATAPQVVELVPPSVVVDGSDISLTIVATGLDGSVSVVGPASLVDHPGRIPVRVASNGTWSASVDLEVVA
jgi:hypothetical protein